MRPIILVPQVTIWREVLHFDSSCSLCPDAVPCLSYRGDTLILKVNQVGSFIYEPELVGGVYRGLLAFVNQQEVDPEWTHATITAVQPNGIVIDIEAPMPDYLGWRFAIQRYIRELRLQRSVGEVCKETQIAMMHNIKPPDGVKRSRIWVRPPNDHELLYI